MQNSKPELVKRHALVVAAGSGRRFGSTLPKQFQKLGDQTVLETCIGFLKQAADWDSILIVSNPEFQDMAQVDGCKSCLGGATRQDSVRSGLEILGAGHEDLVFIHDAARPLVSKVVIGALETAALQTGAAVPILPLVDTIKSCKDDLVQTTVDRTSLWRVQTPQAFGYKLIRDAHKKLAGHNGFTDDASLLETLGLPVAGVPGDERLIKITTPTDLLVARALMEAP